MRGKSVARILCCMAGRKRAKLCEQDVAGLKYFDELAPLLERYLLPRLMVAALKASLHQLSLARVFGTTLWLPSIERFAEGQESRLAGKTCVLGLRSVELARKSDSEKERLEMRERFRRHCQ
jgi:hypothetical protein